MTEQRNISPYGSFVGAARQALMPLAICVATSFGISSADASSSSANPNPIVAQPYIENSPEPYTGNPPPTKNSKKRGEHYGENGPEKPSPERMPPQCDECNGGGGYADPGPSGRTGPEPGP